METFLCYRKARELFSAASFRYSAAYETRGVFASFQRPIHLAYPCIHCINNQLNPSFDRCYFHQTEIRIEDIVEVHRRIHPFVVFLHTSPSVTHELRRQCRSIVVYALLKNKYIYSSFSFAICIYLFALVSETMRSENNVQNHLIKFASEQLHSQNGENDPECTANQ